MFIYCVQIGGKRIHTVRTRGGNTKFRALRLDTGNYSWGSESMAFILTFKALIFLFLNSMPLRMKR